MKTYSPVSRLGLSRFLLLSHTCLCLLSVVSAASSAEFFFGEDVSPYPTNASLDVPRPADFPRSRAAYSNFVARLAQMGWHPEIQTLEHYSSNTFYTYPQAALFNYGTIIGNVCLNYLSATQQYNLKTYCWFSEQTNAAATVGGTFPISGTKYLQIRGLTEQPTISLQTLNGTNLAYGFFATSLRSNSLAVSVDGVPERFQLPTTWMQGPGGVCFFGVIAPGCRWVDLRVVSGFSHAFGLDNLMIAQPGLLTNTVPAAPATLRLDRSIWGIWIEGTVGARYRVEYAPQYPAGLWRPFAEFVLPESPYYVQGIGITNNTSFFRAIGLNE